MRIPIPPSLKIEEFNGGKIVTFETLVKNGVYDKDAKGEWSVTQRPAVNVAQDPTDESVTDVRGRGVYDWAAVDSEYYVNNGEVYKGSYGTPVRESAQSVVGITRTSSTATAEITGHGYIPGDTVLIADAVEPEYNGRQTVLTVPDANHVTYAVTGTPTTPATGTITAQRVFGTGTERVYFFELGDYLVISDPENNEGWYIHSGSSTVLHKITDSNFPPNQTPALQLAKGGFVLNNRWYVPTTAATLHGSPSGDPTASWDALNVISAEFDPDGGVMAFKHDQYGVFLGPRSCEFFQDAGLPTGSPLAPLTHIQHSVGAANEHSAWENGSVNFFLGQSATGEISAYLMMGMQLKKVSTPDIDSFLTTSITTELKRVVGSGVAIGGHVFYALTVYHLTGTNSDPEGLTTLVYDATTDTWGTWGLMQLDAETAPIVDWTKATRTEIGKGILLDGKIVTMADDFVPNDRVIATGWVSSGWVQNGWVSRASTEGTPIRVEIVTGRMDLGTTDRKFVGSYRILGIAFGDIGEVNPNVSLSWSNETNRDYGTARELDPLSTGQRASRCGSFRFRNHKLVFALNKRYKVSGIEAEVQRGNA